MDLDFLDCFGREKTLSNNRRNTLTETPFWKDFATQEACRKLQKIFPFIKMEKHADMPVDLPGSVAQSVAGLEPEVQV